MSATETVEQLESRSAADVPAPEKTPELSHEQKNQLLMVQRQILSLKVNIGEQTKQLETLAPVFNDMVNKMANFHKVDPNKYTFDIDTLSFLQKK